MSTIRKAEKRDVKNIVKRETQCFSTPETEESIFSFIKNPTFSIDVVEEDGNVKGHCIYFFVPGNAEIISVAVSEEDRRHGYGRELVEHVIAEAKNKGLDKVFLEVRSSNVGAIALYTFVGFQQVGERKNLYEKPVEDGIIMQYSIK